MSGAFSFFAGQVDTSHFQKAKRQAEVDHELCLNGAGKMIITIPTMAVWRLLLSSAITGAVEHVLCYAYSV